MNNVLETNEFEIPESANHSILKVMTTMETHSL